MHLDIRDSQFPVVKVRLSCSNTGSFSGKKAKKMNKETRKT